MSVRAAYEQWASTYDTDRNRTRDLDQMVTERVLSRVRGTQILELGCGTGKNTALLARMGEHVHALDFSAAMMERARAKLSFSNITFTQADLTLPWPCADGAVDLIVGNLVLEHIADLPHIFAEAWRCLKPGGHLFICELHPTRQYMGKQATFRHNEIDTLIAAFVHHVSDFFKDAAHAGLTLIDLQEWWHEEDQDKPPRLVSFLWQKRTV
ncbi:MAG: methyltransferase domain-containing protein [Chloroflexaceae bacterium]|nr:methyltransferase domain-containing protein [Chloroflexaceae bacterium]